MTIVSFSQSYWPAFVLLALVCLVVPFFRTPVGDKIGNILPTPFWVYAIPILLTTFGYLPKQTPAYDWITAHVLPAALTLMLIGTPVMSLLKLGRNASIAMAIAAGTMVVAIVSAFALFVKFLPAESPGVAGALLATWVGGSANMIAVKELLAIPDVTMGVMIIVDTVVSYGWMAILMAGAGFQQRVDHWLLRGEVEEEISVLSDTTGNDSQLALPTYARIFLVLLVGFALGEFYVRLGILVSLKLLFINAKAWAILLASTLTVLLALTPAQRLEKLKASRVGSFLLYLVLASIGAKTSLAAAPGAMIFILYGAIVMLIHGSLSLLLGRVFRIPLHLLAVASQANVGGAVSAPIVAGVYRPAVAHVGVLMAILGALIGTYVGLFGAYLCRGIVHLL